MTFTTTKHRWLLLVVTLALTACASTTKHSCTGPFEPVNTATSEVSHG